MHSLFSRLISGIVLMALLFLLATTRSEAQWTGHSSQLVGSNATKGLGLKVIKAPSSVEAVIPSVEAVIPSVETVKDLRPSNSGTESSLCLTRSDEVVSPMLYKNQNPPSCQDAKFLVLYWFKMGFGAALMSAVGAFRMAVHQKRVLLIHTEFGSDFFAAVDSAAHCPNTEAPEAWQCYFQPISATCNMQHALDRAGVKTAAELKTKRNLSYWSNGAKISNNFHDHLSSTKVVFIDTYFPWMSKQSRASRDKMKSWGGLDSSKHDDFFLGVAMRYIIRLNEPTIRMFKPEIEKEVSKLANTPASKIVSLPIRGADKCGTPIGSDGQINGTSRFESACLKFETYMSAVEEVRQFGTDIDTVVITSEDSRYIKAAKALSARLSLTGADKHNLKMVFNDLDEQQGDSRWVAMAKNGAHTHAKIMFSMWSTLELQLRGTFYLINCNSHWHQWIRALRNGGCGFSQPVFFCLDQQPRRSNYFMCTQENSAGRSEFAHCKAQSAREI